MKPVLHHAVLALVPDANVVIRGFDETAEIEWHNPSEPPVTREEINAKYFELVAQYEAENP